MNNTKIVISQQDNIFLIDPSNIIFIKSDNCYTNLHLKGDKRLLVVKSLAQFQRELSYDLHFIRVNQSYLVNLSCIERIDKKNKSIELIENHSVQFTITIKELLLKITQTSYPFTNVEIFVEKPGT